MEILIIGGGIAGISTAYHLVKEYEMSSIGIFEKASGPAQFASGKNSAMVHHFHPNRSMRRLLDDGISRLQSFCERHDPSLLHQRPSLWRFSDSMTTALQKDPEHWGGRRSCSKQEVPDEIRPASAENGHWFCYEKDGLLSPRRFVKTLLSKVEQAGGEFRANTEIIEGTSLDHHWKIASMEDEWTGDKVVNAAGAWGDHIAERLGVDRKGLTPHTRYLFFTEETLLPEEYGFYWDRYEGMYFRHYDQGTLICACDNHPAAPGNFSPVDDPVSTVLREKLNKHYPQFSSVEIQEYWAGQRTRDDHGLPIIKEDPAFPGFYWVAGLYGHGMSASMWAGQEAAEVISS